MEENDADGWNKMLDQHNSRQAKKNVGTIISQLLGSSVFFKLVGVVALIFIAKLILWVFGISL